MYRRSADLGPRRDRPWAAPASTMTEWQAVRVLGSGGGRRRTMRRRGGLTQGHELQGRIHGPAHPLEASVCSGGCRSSKGTCVRKTTVAVGRKSSQASGIPEAKSPDFAAQCGKLRAACNRSCTRHRIGSAEWCTCASWCLPDRADRVHAMLCAMPSAIDVIRVPDALDAPRPGDLVMCDVAREDAQRDHLATCASSGIHHDGVDRDQPDRRDLGLRRRRPRKHGAGRRRPTPSCGRTLEAAHLRPAPSWEPIVPRVHDRRDGCCRRSRSSPTRVILVIGAMVVGPEFGALAGICVGLTQRRLDLAAGLAGRDRGSGSRWRSWPPILAALAFRRRGHRARSTSPPTRGRRRRSSSPIPTPTP